MQEFSGQLIEPASDKHRSLFCCCIMTKKMYCIILKVGVNFLIKLLISFDEVRLGLALKGCRDQMPRSNVVIDAEKRFIFDIDTWAQCYKTFYGHNLLMFEIS